MFCAQCGSELPDGAAYCRVCGAPVRRPRPAPEPPVPGPADAAPESVENGPLPAAAPDGTGWTPGAEEVPGAEETPGAEKTPPTEETPGADASCEPAAPACPPLRDTFVPRTEGAPDGLAGPEDAVYREDRIGWAHGAARPGAPSGPDFCPGAEAPAGPAYRNEPVRPDSPARPATSGPAYRRGLDDRTDAAEDPVGMGEWLLACLAAAVPVLNIVLFCIWGFGGETKPSKRSWARAQLILLAVVSALGILLLVLVVAFLASGIMPLRDPFY